MLRIFWGMILGSMTTMILLGGASAADQVIANTQTLYLQYWNSLDTRTTFMLLIMVSMVLGVLTFWPTKLAHDPKQVIKHLRRHC